MMIAVVVLLAGVAMASSDPLGCSLHGQAHVLMTDGHTRHQLTGSGLADIFSTSGLDVQCDINQTSSAQSTISSCRFLISSTTSPCSVDIVHGDQPGHVSVWGQVLPVTSLEEFVSANVDPALGLTCHAVDDDTITIEITQRDAERFILIESSLNSFTITTSNVTSCSGACGTCQGPQTAPRPDTFAVMPFRAIQHQRRCPQSSTSAPVVVPQLPQAVPYSDASSATPIAAFTSAEARDSIIADCSGHDSARLQADSLFAGFVEACAEDIATGSSPAIAKANMDSFVKVIENRQKVELAADALQRNPATVVCAACMSVEWDHPINTTSVLDTAKMLNAAGTGSQRAKHRSMYKKPAGPNLYVKKTHTPQDLSFPASDLASAPTSAPSSTVSPSTTQPSSSFNPTSSPSSSSVPSSYAPTSSPSSAAGSSSQPTSSPFNTDSIPKYTPMPSSTGPSSPHKPLYERHFKPATDVSEGISFPAPSTSAPLTGYDAPIQITSAPINSSSSAPTTTPPTGYDSLPATQQPMTSAPYTSQPTTAPGTSVLPKRQRTSMPTSSPSGNDTAPVTVMPTTMPAVTAAATSIPTSSPTLTPVPTPVPSVGNSTAPRSTTSSPTSSPINSSSVVPATSSPSNLSSAMPATTSPSNLSSAMPATTSPSNSAMPAKSSPLNSSSAMPATSSPTANSSMPPSSTSSPTTSPSGGSAPSTSSPTSVPSPAPTSDFTAAAQSSSPTSSPGAPSTVNGSLAPVTTMPSPTSSASMPAFTSSPNASTSVPTSSPGNQSLGASQFTSSPIGSQAPITTSPSNLTATQSPVPTPAPSSSNVAAATIPPSNMSNPSTTSPGSNFTTSSPQPSIIGFNVTSGLPIFSSVPTPIPSVNLSNMATPVPTNNGSSALPATKQPEKTNATRPPITLSPVNISVLLPTTSPLSANGTVRPMTTVPVVMSTVAPTTVPVVTVSPAVPVVLGTIAPTSVPSYPGVILPSTTSPSYAATVAPTTQPLTGRGSVYGCHCNISEVALKDSLDKVQYALDSYLIDALAKSVLDGYDHDLLTVIACGLGGVRNVNIKALSISENVASDLCRQCEISQRSPSAPSAPSAATPGRRTRNIIPNTTNGNVPSTPTMSSRNGNTDYTSNVNSVYLPPSVSSGYPSIPNGAPLTSNVNPSTPNGYPSVLTGNSGYTSTMNGYPSTKTGNGIYPNRDVPSTPSMSNPRPTGTGSGIYPNRDMTSPLSSMNYVPSTEAENGVYPNRDVNSMMQTVGNGPSAGAAGTDLYPNRDASSASSSAIKSGIYPNRDAKMNNLPSSAGNNNGYSSREASATKQISTVSRTRSQGFSIMA